VEVNGQMVGLFADELLGQQQAVIKGLSSYLGRSRGVSGCTILGNGEVSLILDVNALLGLAHARA
jgi:two-component system chemotaxis sensor kinase CheA